MKMKLTAVLLGGALSVVTLAGFSTSLNGCFEGVCAKPIAVASSTVVNGCFEGVCEVKTDNGCFEGVC